MLMILYRRDESGAPFYYTLDDRQQNLFNPHSLTVSWGKHPEGGRKKHYTFATLAEKNHMVRKLLGSKLKTYKVLYSYFKEKQEVMRGESAVSASEIHRFSPEASARPDSAPSRSRH